MNSEAPPPLLVRNARVVTLAGDMKGMRRGADVGSLGVIAGGDVLLREGLIAAVDVGIEPPRDARVIEAGGRVLMPAFVDPHTHACWAGDRLGEWEAKLGGASYLELLRRGGGIMSTVRAVRSASEEELTGQLAKRLTLLARHGTATAEVKSGYGLSTADELKMLRAIVAAGDRSPVTVVPTACIGHAIDPTVPGFVERTIHETLPAVNEAFPGIAVDAYCENGAWSLEECVRLFESAAALGHPVRVHADQFHELGMVDEAIRLGAVSCDHLEATSPAALGRLAGSATAGVMLPCSGFHLDQRYADGRGFVDAGGLLAIGSNFNPGSAPCPSMAMTIALACRFCGLSPAEAIACATHNAAALLGFEDRGRIEAGMRADLVLLGCCDERDLAFTFGWNPCGLVVIGGRVVTGGG